MELYEYVALQLRSLRLGYNSGEGLSQEKLAEEINVAPNTISRWETGAYRPDLMDLEKLARFFGKSILYFFPAEEAPADENLMALLHTAKELPPEDLKELKNYAEFRRARALYEKRPRAGRKKKERK